MFQSSLQLNKIILTNCFDELEQKLGNLFASKGQRLNFSTKKKTKFDQMKYIKKRNSNHLLQCIIILCKYLIKLIFTVEFSGNLFHNKLDFVFPLLMNVNATNGQFSIDWLLFGAANDFNTIRLQWFHKYQLQHYAFIVWLHQAIHRHHVPTIHLLLKLILHKTI